MMLGLHRKEINVSSAIFPQHLPPSLPLSLPPATSRSHLFISCFRTEFKAEGEFLWSWRVHNSCRAGRQSLGEALLGNSDVIKRLKEVLPEMALVV